MPHYVSARQHPPDVTQCRTAIAEADRSLPEVDCFYELSHRQTKSTVLIADVRAGHSRTGHSNAEIKPPHRLSHASALTDRAADQVLGAAVGQIDDDVDFYLEGKATEPMSAQELMSGDCAGRFASGG
eukprot:676975-Rhodomonas_salina.2